jgi:hypothetical protein
MYSVQNIASLLSKALLPILKNRNMFLCVKSLYENERWFHDGVTYEEQTLRPIDGPQFKSGFSSCIN